jgi:membrane protein YqaA with SNARE-associated domain
MSPGSKHIREDIPPILRVNFVEFLNWLQNTDQGIFLFVLSFANAIILPVGPEVAFVPILMVSHEKFVPYAMYCVVGNVLGLMLIYTVSYYWSQTFMDKYVSPAKIEKGVAVFTKYGSSALVIASMFPFFPFRILVIISGCLKQRPLTVFSFLLIGKTLRFFGYGFLIAKMGESVIKYLK